MPSVKRQHRVAILGSLKFRSRRKQSIQTGRFTLWLVQGKGPSVVSHDVGAECVDIRLTANQLSTGKQAPRKTRPRASLQDHRLSFISLLDRLCSSRRPESCNSMYNTCRQPLTRPYNLSSQVLILKSSSSFGTHLAYFLQLTPSSEPPTAGLPALITMYRAPAGCMFPSNA